MKLLDVNNMEVLKIIRVQDNSKWNYFAGNLYYTRKMTKDYQSHNVDFIDDMIFESIKKDYPDSRIVVNKNIMWENQMNETINSYSGANDVEFKITFMPSIPYDKMDKISNIDTRIHTKEFNINRISLTEKETLKYMTNHIQADIPFEKITEFNTKIQTINFKK